MSLRHSLSIRPTTRDTTPARLAAVHRALMRERDPLPLFADQVPVEQGTAEQRIARLDAAFHVQQLKWRDLAARQWRQPRRV